MWLSPFILQCELFLHLPRLYTCKKFRDLSQGKLVFSGVFFWDLCIFLWYLPLQHGLEFWISYGCRCLEFPISPRTGEKSQLVWIFLRRSSTLSLLLERSLDVYFAKVILSSHLETIQKLSESTAKNANINIRYMSKCLIST